MAELTSNDVQQAVQQSIRNLEANVLRLSSDVSKLSNQLQALSDIARNIQTLRQNLQQNLGTQTSGMSFNSAPNMNQVEDKISSIQSDVQDLKNTSTN